MLVVDVNNDVDAAEETAGSDDQAEDPAITVVFASALSDSPTFGNESTVPATGVGLQMKGRFSTLIIAISPSISSQQCIK